MALPQIPFRALCLLTYDEQGRAVSGNRRDSLYQSTCYHIYQSRETLSLPPPALQFGNNYGLADRNWF